MNGMKDKSNFISKYFNATDEGIKWLPVIFARKNYIKYGWFSH